MTSKNAQVQSPEVRNPIHSPIKTRGVQRTHHTVRQKVKFVALRRTPTKIVHLKIWTKGALLSKKKGKLTVIKTGDIILKLNLNLN